MTLRARLSSPGHESLATDNRETGYHALALIIWTDADQIQQAPNPDISTH
jgi:hypothetical protein